MLRFQRKAHLTSYFTVFYRIRVKGALDNQTGLRFLSLMLSTTPPMAIVSEYLPSQGNHSTAQSGEVSVSYAPESRMVHKGPQHRSTNCNAMIVLSLVDSVQKYPAHTSI